MQVVGMVGLYQYDPKQSHLVAVTRIFKYLKGTMNYGLWYPKNQNFQLTSYLDVNWKNCVYERKSTSCGAFFLGDSLVAWLSKKTRIHFIVKYRGRIHFCCYLLHTNFMDDRNSCRFEGNLH